MAIAFRAADSALGNSSSAEIARPTGTVSGDLMIWIVEVYSSSTTFSDPSGWTNALGSDTYFATDNNLRCKVFYKISDGTESPSASLSASRNWVTSIASYSGCDGTTPVDTTDWSITSLTLGASDITTTAVTATTGQWLVSLVGAADSVASWSTTNNRTERTEISHTTSGIGPLTVIADSNGTVSGSVTTAFTFSAAADACRAVSLLLNEAGGSSVNANAGHAAASVVANNAPLKYVQAGLVSLSATANDGETTSPVQVHTYDATVEEGDPNHTDAEAGHAAASVAAEDASTVHTASGGDAAASVAAEQAQGGTTVPAEDAVASVVALDATTAHMTAAGEVTASATAEQPDAEGVVAADAGHAAVSVAAFDAEASTLVITNAPAGHVSVSATAEQVAIAETTPAEDAGVTVGVFSPTALVAPTPGAAEVSATALTVESITSSATGGHASVSVAAEGPSALNSPTAGTATAAAAAEDATAPVEALAGHVAASATTNDPTVTGAGGIKPDAILASTNLTGAVTDIDEDPDFGDANWLTCSSPNLDTDLRVSFPTPGATLNPDSNEQEFRVLLRKTNHATDPSAVIELWVNGSFQATVVASTTITSTTGQILSGFWTSSGLAAADIELRVVGTVGGGTPSDRACVEVGAIEWNASLLDDQFASAGLASITVTAEDVPLRYAPAGHVAASVAANQPTVDLDDTLGEAGDAGTAATAYGASVQVQPGAGLASAGITAEQVAGAIAPRGGTITADAAAEQPTPAPGGQAGDAAASVTVLIPAVSPVLESTTEAITAFGASVLIAPSAGAATSIASVSGPAGDIGTLPVETQSITATALLERTAHTTNAGSALATVNLVNLFFTGYAATTATAYNAFIITDSVPPFRVAYVVDDSRVVKVEHEIRRTEVT